MLKDLSGVMIGDLLIFDFPGVIGKGNTMTVQDLSQLRIRLWVLVPPQFQRPLIIAHGESSYGW